MLPRIRITEDSKRPGNGKECVKERRYRSRPKGDPERFVYQNGRKLNLGGVKKSIPKNPRAGFDCQATDKKATIFTSSSSRGHFLRDVMMLKRRHSSSSFCATLADTKTKQPILIRNNHISLRKYSCPDLHSQLVPNNHGLQTARYELQTFYKTGNVSTATDDHKLLPPANLSSTSDKAEQILDNVKNINNDSITSPPSKTLKIIDEISSDSATNTMNDLPLKAEQKAVSDSDEDSTKSRLSPDWIDNSDLSYTGEVRNRNNRIFTPKFQATRGRESIIAWLQDVSLA